MSRKLPQCEFDADKLVMKIDRSIRADLEEIPPLIEEIMGTVREMRCAEGKEFEIELALHEALVNAVVHGSKRDPSKRVQVYVGCDEGRGILIVVRDSGTGFKPADIPSPIMGQNIFSTHGRGLYLINELMDEVAFENGGTEIRMLKR